MENDPWSNRTNVAAGEARIEDDWSIEEETPLQGIIAALLVTLKECRVAISEYGNKNRAKGR